jgi:hypothetical protein
MSNWREHVRVIALILNGLFVLSLIGLRGWAYPTGFGVPFIVPPLVAVIALAVNRARGLAKG